MEILSVQSCRLLRLERKANLRLTSAYGPHENRCLKRCRNEVQKYSIIKNLGRYLVGILCRQRPVSVSYMAAKRTNLPIVKIGADGNEVIFIHSSVFVQR